MKFAHLAAERILFGSHPFADPLQKVLHRLTGGKVRTFEFKQGIQRGMKFRCETTGKYFYVREDYERELLKPILRCVHSGSIVYDIGAHSGQWTLVFSRLCEANGTVVAFEPDPANRNRLNENLQLNSIQNVMVVSAAASDSTGENAISGNGSMSAVGVGSIPISTITLDEFTKHNPAPDFILIDVEGHGAEVLAGAEEILRRGKTSITCEIHNEREAEAFRVAAAISGSKVETVDSNHVFFRSVRSAN